MKDHHRMRAWDGEKYWVQTGLHQFQVINGGPDWKYAHELEEEHSNLVWEQCTGLRDKNGVLIWEGDTEPIGKIHFNNGAFWVYRNDAPYLLGDVHDQIEITGNIHQNPGLLE